MESTTYQKNIKISPKKLRVYLNSIKKLTPVEAVNLLFYTQGKAALVFHKVLKSAINNAKNTLKIDSSLLKFKVLTIDEGQKVKRSRPGGRGTAKPFKMRYSHIKIIFLAEKSTDGQLAKKTKTSIKTKENKPNPKKKTADEKIKLPLKIKRKNNGSKS